VSPWSPADAAALRAARDVLRDAGDDLASVLYRSWYAAPRHDEHDREHGDGHGDGHGDEHGGEHCGEHDDEPAVDRVAARDLPPLAGVLRAAHDACDRWDEGRVVGTGRGGVVVVVCADEPPRAVLPGDHVHRAPDRRGVAPEVGDVLLVRRRADVPTDDGWWHTWGAGFDLAHRPDEVTRLYLAVRPDRVAQAVRTVTRCLAAGSERWSMKVVARREDLLRPDAVVVYVAAPLAEVVASPLAASLVEGTSGLLRAATPPLTRPLAPGVAAAEDPGDGRSFGERVCALVAAAATGEGGDPTDWLTAVADMFVRAGLSPSAPYLRPAGGGLDGG